MEGVEMVEAEQPLRHLPVVASLTAADHPFGRGRQRGGIGPGSQNRRQHRRQYRDPAPNLSARGVGRSYQTG